MTLTVPALKILWHRAVLALVLAAFLCPVPGRMPADEVKAAYAAAGMLCAPDGKGQAHHDAHCALCLLPASNAPDIADCSISRQVEALYIVTAMSGLIASAQQATRNARAPPSSIV